MLVYSRNVAFVSLLISLFTAMLVYAAIDLHHDRSDPDHDAFDAGLLARRPTIPAASSARQPAPTRSASPSANCR